MKIKIDQNAVRRLGEQHAEAYQQAIDEALKRCPDGSLDEQTTAACSALERMGASPDRVRVRELLAVRHR